MEMCQREEEDRGAPNRVQTKYKNSFFAVIFLKLYIKEASSVPASRSRILGLVDRCIELSEVAKEC